MKNLLLFFLMVSCINIFSMEPELESEIEFQLLEEGRSDKYLSVTENTKVLVKVGSEKFVTTNYGQLKKLITLAKNINIDIHNLNQFIRCNKIFSGILAAYTVYLFVLYVERR